MPATFLYAVDRVFERVFEEPAEGGPIRVWSSDGVSPSFLTALLAIPRLGGIGLSLALLCAQVLLLAGRIIYVERALSARESHEERAFASVLPAPPDSGLPMVFLVTAPPVLFE